MLDQPPELGLSRRLLLKSGAALIVAFAVPDMPGTAAAQTASAKTVDINSLDAFLAISPDGSVTLYTGKVDLGTGARAAFRQICAEELDIAMSRITLIEGDTDLTPDQGSTVASQGISDGGMQIRQAAATARDALIAMAADKFRVPGADFTVEDGIVQARDGRSVSYGELLAGGRFDLKIDKTVAVKSPASYRLVGKSAPRPDLPDKMTGRHIYIQDFKLDGMLHGRIVRPPAFDAELVSVDENSIAGIPGTQIVRIKNLLGVVAESEWNAVRASRQLKAVWRGGRELPGNDGLFAAIRATPLDNDEIVTNVGDAPAVMKNAATRFEAVYEWPAQSHASMGPSCAVADVRADSATIWSASQGTHRIRPLYAQALGMKQEKVRVIYLDGAGCYGMNGHNDVGADAMLLSKAVSRPVRVQWMREEEHGWDPKGPPQLLTVRAGLDESGAITAWETEAWLPVNTAGVRNVPLYALDAAGITQPMGNFSAGISGNVAPSFPLPNVRATIHWLKTTPIRPSNLRAPGKLGNTMAVDGMVDEIAASLKIDPLEFRLRHIKDPKGIEALRRVAARFDWQSRAAPRGDAGDPIARGRGIAYVVSNVGNHTATAIELTIDRRSGAIAIERVALAYDCGQIINPDGVQAQCEGCVVQGISRTLFEEVRFDHARVTSVDWSSYRVMGFAELPKIEIDLIDYPQEKPSGAAEAPSVPIPSAIANAVFDAVGIRMRTAPLTPERVLAALGAKQS